MKRPTARTGRALAGLATCAHFIITLCQRTSRSALKYSQVLRSFSHVLVGRTAIRFLKMLEIPAIYQQLTAAATRSARRVEFRAADWYDLDDARCR